MPVLMLALLALAAFGLIGVLLAAAVFLELRSEIHKPGNASGSAPVTLHKHAV